MNTACPVYQDRCQGGYRGRAAASHAASGLRLLVPLFSEPPENVGGRFATRYEWGVPFVWLGSIERALGFPVPQTAIDDEIYDSDELYKVDPSIDVYPSEVPRLIRRKMDGKRGRPALAASTTLWLRLDVVPEVLQRFDDELAGDVDRSRRARLFSFLRGDLEDLELYLLEKEDGSESVSPTRSGRHQIIELVIDGTVCPVVFDPFSQEPWFTLSQAALVYGTTLVAMRRAILRARKSALVIDGDILSRMGKGRDGRYRPVTYVSWKLICLLAAPVSMTRYIPLMQWVATLHMTVRESRKVESRYVLSDFR